MHSKVYTRMRIGDRHPPPEGRFDTPLAMRRRETFLKISGSVRTRRFKENGSQKGASE